MVHFREQLIQLYLAKTLFVKIYQLHLLDIALPVNTSNVNFYVNKSSSKIHVKINHNRNHFVKCY